MLRLIASPPLGYLGGKSLCIQAFCLAALYNEDIGHTLLLLLRHRERMLGLL